MLSRRFFAGCALCAIGGLAATAAEAQTTPPAATAGVKRTILKQTDGPVPGYVTVTAEAEIDAGATVARHTHPGIESGYLIEGGGELSVDGQPSQMLKPGDGFQNPAGVPHGLKNGPKTSKLAITYIVEKGKPLATPA
jgi:quercetin dioxygenase-like cupin family protein